MQECEATCPKGISIENIAIMNRHYVEASFAQRPAMSEAGAG
jgi:heterodisulfide reductase subunit C